MFLQVNHLKKIGRVILPLEEMIVSKFLNISTNYRKLPYSVQKDVLFIRSLLNMFADFTVLRL